MNRYQVLRLLQKSGQSVFSSNEIKRYTKLKDSGVYSVLRRMTQEGLILNVEHGKYTISQDPFIVASQIQQPAYISFLSGLFVLGATDQVINKIQVASSRRRRGLVFENTVIDFIGFPAELMFGYKKVRKENSYVMVGELEKIILDFLYRPSDFGINYAIDAIRSDIDLARVELYLKRAHREAVLARTGYVLNELGFEVNFHRTTSTVYRLNPQSERAGRFNRKWRLMVNEAIK